MTIIGEDANEIILVSGPSRSGKSKWAEHLLRKKLDVVYIATSDVIDDKEWQERILLHQERRPSSWKLIEAPDNLESSIHNLPSNNAILIDSLGTYISKFLNIDNNKWLNIENSLINFFSSEKRLIVIVIEETGWGVVPSTSIGNVFRDRLGSMSQKLQKISNKSWLVIQGRAINLKEMSAPVP
tara:strand:- start:7963 stop:8514 length:552 start_codon:yes stop_codon:yes gene_type:complete